MDFVPRIQYSGEGAVYVRGSSGDTYCKIGPDHRLYLLRLSGEFLGDVPMIFA